MTPYTIYAHRGCVHEHGNTRLKYQFLCGAPLLADRVHTDYAYTEFWNALLFPYTHYIPITMDDVLEQVGMSCEGYVLCAWSIYVSCVVVHVISTHGCVINARADACVMCEWLVASG